MNIKQLPSEYKLVNGSHMVKYTFSTSYPYVFTEMRGLWEELLGEDLSSLVISEDKRTASYLEHIDRYSRAVVFSDPDLTFMFKDIVNLPSTIVCPDKFKI